MKQTIYRYLDNLHKMNEFEVYRNIWKQCIQKYPDNQFKRRNGNISYNEYSLFLLIMIKRYY